MMRITINRMRESLAHMFGSGQAIFGQDGILARHRSELLTGACAASPLHEAHHPKIGHFELRITRFSSNPQQSRTEVQF
jgi:hypothetical protein